MSVTPPWARSAAGHTTRMTAVNKKVLTNFLINFIGFGAPANPNPCRVTGSHCQVNEEKGNRINPNAPGWVILTHLAVGAVFLTIGPASGLSFNQRHLAVEISGQDLR